MIISKAECVQTTQMAESEQNYDFLQTFKNSRSQNAKLVVGVFFTDMQMVFIVCNEEAVCYLYVVYQAKKHVPLHFTKDLRFSFPH